MNALRACVCARVFSCVCTRALATLAFENLRRRRRWSLLKKGGKKKKNPYCSYTQLFKTHHRFTLFFLLLVDKAIYTATL
jgi:hypothetical protein